MNIIRQSLTFLLLLVCAQNWAQENPPVAISQGTFIGESIALRDAPLKAPFNSETEELLFVDMRRLDTNGLGVNGSENGSEDGFDGAVQSQAPKFSVQNLLQNFDGINQGEAGSGVPDPTGAVGPNHYVAAVNSTTKVFDKEGNLLAGPTTLNSVLGIAGNGDPIVMYDQLADRFFVSQFAFSNNSVTIGVSTTADPTGTYYVYNYPLGQFPDYPHYAVWPEAYILTANKGGQTTYVFDRETMLRGGEDPALVGFNLNGAEGNFNTVFGPQAANLLGRVAPIDAPGYIVYLQDDSWGNDAITFDHLKVWSIDIDFDGASTISDPEVIPIADFDSFFAPFGSGDFEQPGTTQKIDGITGLMSYMPNYRSFDDHNSLLVNFNVDVEGRGGIRWVELRNVDNGPFTLFQEGTYILDDDVNRFMGSMSIDKDGNFGLGYNVVGPTVFPGMRYAGRLVDDAELGTINVEETSIIEGPGGVGVFNRFGDYAQMTMDIDNRTFWYTAEYMGETDGIWSTRIASFTLGEEEVDDVAVFGFEAPLYQGPFSDSETITALIANFGTNDQADFDIELRVDGVLITTDTFDGTLAAGTYGFHEFTVPVNMAAGDGILNLSAKTLLVADSYNENDAFNFNYLIEKILNNTDITALERRLLIYPLEDKMYEINFATNAFYENVSYRMFDIQGSLIATAPLVNTGNGYRSQVDMNIHQSGVYIVEITDDTFKVSKKILVR